MRRHAVGAITAVIAARALVACAGKFNEQPRPDGGIGYLDASFDDEDPSLRDGATDAAKGTRFAFISLESQPIVARDAGAGPDANSDASDASTATGFFQVAAFLVDGPLPSSDGGVTCTTVGHGVCDARKCSGGEAADAGSAPPTGVAPNAGTIHATGANVGSDVMLVPNGAGRYETKTGARALWSGGESITFNWSGASGGASGPPAGQGSVAAPAPVDLVAPLFARNASDVIAIPRTTTTLTWTKPAGLPAKSRLDVVFGVTGDPSVTVTCAFDAAQTSAIIPGDALAEVPAGLGFFRMSTSNSANTTSADWRFVFDLTSTATINGSSTDDSAEFLP